MPKKKPAYTLHKPTNQARVRIDGKDHYLGKYGSPESRDRYDDLVNEWFTRQGDVSNYTLTIDELCLLYNDHATTYYQKNGVATSEVNNIRIALRPLVNLFGPIRAMEFSPKKLKAVRDAMIEAGCVRTSINRQVGRIKRMFRWAVENEYVPATVYTALNTVAGLRAGRSDVKEADPVQPVSQAMVDAIEPHVSRQVWAMIQLQLLTGMRPGEVLAIRGCDLNMVGRIWEYRPQNHKTEHHGKERVIFIGPAGQAIIRDFLKADLSAFLFSPADARREYHATRTRSTPLTPSQKTRKPKSNPKKQPGESYTVSSYGQAIRKGCEKAFRMPDELQQITKAVKSLPMAEQAATRERLKAEAAAWRKEHCWHPHQLRHNAATNLRREYGIEAARTVLGHGSSAVTEIYAEMDRNKARDIIGQVG